MGENPKNNQAFRRIEIESVQCSDWPDGLLVVVYFDHHGNAIAGLNTDYLSRDAAVQIESCRVPRAMTFSSVSPGTVFCYEKSNGLMEIAINQGNAGDNLGTHV